MSLIAILKSIKTRKNGEEIFTYKHKWESIHVIKTIDDLLGVNAVVSYATKGVLNSQELQRFPIIFQNFLQGRRQKADQSDIFSILKDYNVFRNLDARNDKDIFFAVDKITGDLVEGNFLAATFTDAVMNKEDLLKLKATSPVVRFVYDPSLPYGFLETGKSIKAFNKFKVHNWDTIPDTPLPPCFPKFFEHLFPDPFQRAQVYAWASFAETSHLNFALVLYGAKGAGKSSFIELLKNMYNRELVVQISDGYFDAKFTGEIEHKKLAILEEVTCRGLKAKSKLKIMMNDWITVERKGENPRSGVQSFCNFIFTTNEAYSLEVEPDDRRFYIPDITKDIVPASIISEVLKNSTNLPILKAVRKYFLENRDEEFDPFYPKKNTASFWEMSRQSAPESIDFIITELEKSRGMELTYSELKEMWNRRPVKGNFQRFPHKAVLKRFFTHYCPGGKQLVTVGPYGTEYKIENEEIKIEKDPGMFS